MVFDQKMSKIRKLGPFGRKNRKDKKIFDFFDQDFWYSGIRCFTN